MLRSALVLLGAINFLASCGETKNSEKLQEKKSAFSRANNFFAVHKEKVKNKNYNTSKIGIHENALGKDFLFHGSMMAQVPLAQFSGIKSRIIFFEKHNDKLYMKESHHGHSVSSSIQQDILLAEFDILDQNNGTIYFDFAKGFQKIYYASEWRAPDLEGDVYEESWDSAALSISYIDRAEITEESIEITQVGQMSLGSLIHLNSPVTMRYILKPYTENQDFKPTTVSADDFDTYGYFTVSPQVFSDQSDVSFASKFDHKKKIIYGISHNTPEEYRSAIKEGILYWNKAFGQEIVQVVELPEGITAPNHKHNIIQWVDWNDAGFAYADAQMNPHTGETHHAQVFLTSAFAFSSRDEVEFLLKKLRNDKKQSQTQDGEKKQHKHKKFSLKGFEHDHLCDFDPTESLEDLLGNLLSQVLNLDDEKISRISKDYIREVVSHEVGHTLGLRHNFAGTRHGEASPLEKESLFHDYLFSNQLTEKVTTSSVMDYQKFMDAVITGAQIAQRTDALDYDKIAIRHLYFGENFPTYQIPLFCTDSHVGKYIDCNRFDSGSTMAAHWLSSQRDAINYLPHRLVDLFVQYKMTGDLEILNLKASAYAQRLLAGRISAMESLQRGKKVLSVRRSEQMRGAKEEDMILAERDFLAQDFADYKIFEELFADTEEIFDVQDMFHQFLNLISEEVLLSTEEKIVAARKAQEMFSDLYGELVRGEMTAVVKLDKLYHHDELAEEFFQWIQKRSSKLLLTVEEENQIIVSTVVDESAKDAQDKEKEVTFDIPIFKYHYITRVLAAKALGNHWIDSSFSEYDKNRIKKTYTDLLDAGIQKTFTNVYEKNYKTKTLRRWIWENKEVVSGFSSSILTSSNLETLNHKH